MLSNIQNILLFYNIKIKNNLNKKNNLKNIWNNLSVTQKKILNNIIILDLIKDKIDNEQVLENKIKLLADVKLKLYYPKILFTIIFKEILNKKNKYLLSKELFSRKSLEEQNNIKNNIRLYFKEKYKKMTASEKKIYNLKKRKRNIEKYGIDKYKERLRIKYNTWYRSLSKEKLIKISNKRKERYNSLSDDKKEEYKLNKIKKYNNMSLNEKKLLFKKYKERRQHKLDSMNIIEKNNYIKKIKKQKLKYFNNLPESKKKYYYKIKTLSRQFKNNKISLNEYNKRKILLNEQYLEH